MVDGKIYPALSEATEQKRYKYSSKCLPTAPPSIHTATWLGAFQNSLNSFLKQSFHWRKLVCIVIDASTGDKATSETLAYMAGDNLEMYSSLT